MSIENETPVEQIEESLDDFSSKFFGQNDAATEDTAKSEDVEEQKDDNDAPTNEESVETTQGDDDPDDEEDDTEEEVAPPPKRTRTQKRIEELNTKFRETERKLNEALAKLEAKEQPAPVQPANEVDKDAPDPQAKLEDGTEKYPLGEFDPKYQADLVKHLFAKERAEFEKARTVEEQNRKMQEQQTAAMTEWEQKLVPARERYPDFQEKGQELIDSFSDLDPNYSVYLTDVLMNMDHGPDVLYYLSNNPDEAHKIVNSGHLKATIALGKIEAKFAAASEEKQKARPRVSNAPTPPPALNKGSSGTVKKSFDDMSLDEVTAAMFSQRRY